MADYTELAKQLREACNEHCRDGDLWPFDDMGKAAEAIEALQAENARLKARLEKAREALKPFQRAAEDVGAMPGFLGEGIADSQPIAGNWIELSAGHLRAARAFMEEGE